MTYQTLLESEIKESEYLLILKPRIKLTGFTLVSGSVYSFSFPYSEYVFSLEINGVPLTKTTSATPSAGQFNWDQSTKTGKLRLSDSSDPSLSFVVAFFELYFSTLDVNYYRDPEDTSSFDVFYEPTISKSPDIKNSVSDLFAGYMPTQSTQLILDNSEHALEPILKDASFYLAKATMYHWLSEDGILVPTNIEKVMDGICSNFTYDTDAISIVIRDRVELLDAEWRNYSDDNFYSVDLFPELDPSFVGKPIRYIFGKCRGVVPVNVGYLNEEYDNTNNRERAVMSENNNISEKVYTVAASPSSTTTRTYLNTTVGLDIDDTINLNDTYYSIIRGVNRISNYIDHDTIASPLSPSDQVKRGFVSRVDIIQSGVKYTALYGRDYTCDQTLLGTQISGFVFSDNLESNLSMPENLNPFDLVYCTVYGTTNFVTKGGSPFGANDSELGNLCDPTIILYEILKNKIGLGEDDLDLDSFTDLFTNYGGEAIGLSIPKGAGDEFPHIKEIVIELLNTMLASIFIDANIKWSVKKTDKMGANDFEIDSSEIMAQSFDISYDYDDILSDVLVEYDERQADENGSNSGNISSTVYAHSDKASLLHKINRQKTFKSLHIKEAEAQKLCDNLRDIYGDRESTFRIKAPSRFYQSKIGDKVNLRRDKLPGGAFIDGIEHVQGLVIKSINKTLSGVTLELTDQKGIEESDTWVV